MCIFGGQESAQLLRLLDMLPPLCENTKYLASSGSHSHSKSETSQSKIKVLLLHEYLMDDAFILQTVCYSMETTLAVFNLRSSNPLLLWKVACRCLLMTHATHWKMNVCKESGPLDFWLVLKHWCSAIDNMPACCFTSFFAIHTHHMHTHTHTHTCMHA